MVRNSCKSLICIDIALLHPKGTLHELYRSQIVKMNLEFYKRNWPFCPLASMPYRTSFWCGPSCKNSVSSCKCSVSSVDNQCRHCIHENHHLALLQIVEDNESLKKGVAYTIAEILRHQVDDPYCGYAAYSVRTVNFEYTIGKNGYIVLVAPIDGAAQVPIAQTLWEPLLYHSHYPVVVRYTSQRLVHASTRWELFWSHMENNVYTTAGTWNTCARNRASLRMKSMPQLFRSNSSPKVVAIDTKECLSRTPNEKQFENNTTDKYSKVKQTLTTRKTSSSHIVNVFFNFVWSPVASLPTFLQAMKWSLRAGG